MQSLEFHSIGLLLAVLTLALLTPGPDMILVLRHGVRSRRHGRFAALGILCGIALQVTILALGFSALPELGQLVGLLRYGGAAYLLWLAWCLLHAEPTPAGETAPAGSRPFREGLLCNLTNPKAFAFFSAVFTGDLARPEILALVIFCHAGILWLSLNELLQIPRVKRGLLAREQVLLRTCGALLACFAVALATGT